PAVLAILIAAPQWAWALLVAAAAAVALLEFYGLVSAAGWIVPRTLGFLAFGGLLVAAYQRSPALVVLVAGLALFVLPAFVMFASPPEAILLPSSAASVFATLYVAAGAGSMIALRAHGWKPILFLLVVVWAGDSASPRSSSPARPTPARSTPSWPRRSASSSRSSRSWATSSSRRSRGAPPSR